MIFSWTYNKKSVHVSYNICGVVIDYIYYIIYIYIFFPILEIGGIIKK